MPEPDPVALAVEATTLSAVEPTLDLSAEPTSDVPAEPILDVAVAPLAETAPARLSTPALAEPTPLETTLAAPAPVGMTLAERVLAELELAERELAEQAPVEVAAAEPVTPTQAPDPVAPTAAPTPRSTAPGRRKATTRASIRPPRAARAEAPVVRSRDTTRLPARRSAGSHASHVTQARRSPLRRLPSVPLLIGIAALVMSAGGAITAANNGSDYGYSTRYSQASALTGVSDVTRVNLLDPRDTKVVSRDSSRKTASSGADPTLVNLAKDQAKDRTETLTKFAEQAQATSARIKRNLWLLPTTGYHLTARFGDVGLWQHFHTGLDFAAPAGTSIVSIAEGVVTSAGYDGAYGNKTVITLNDGTEIWYCHQTSIYVNVGETVKAGERIGTVGYTGHTTGSHLHIEVRPGGGDPVDPYAAFIVHGVTP